MKINEFLKKVNKIFYAEYSYDSNTIYVYKTEQDMCDENKCDDDTYYFMSVKVCDKKFSLFFDSDWVPEDVKGLSFLFNLLRELEDTPVKERFPEKKYRLRWIDSNGIPNYLDNREGVWTTESITNARCYTESELEQLKKDNLDLAPAIDAMKEPAEDIK